MVENDAQYLKIGLIFYNLIPYVNLNFLTSPFLVENYKVGFFGVNRKPYVIDQDMSLLVES